MMINRVSLVAFALLFLSFLVKMIIVDGNNISFSVSFFLCGFFCYQLLHEIRSRNNFCRQINETFNDLKNNDYFID